ncbi:MAG TPA: glutathione S-transferase family protein [Steroidobacteraceae bacterium]|nr:glutathione S-transferase family protein [Steroidobacteraceae bacterium]
MKLYSFPGAPSPMRVELMLKYKGVELETEIVNIRDGAQFDPSFREVNPRCTVPALLLDDGSCLSEVIAICLFLDGRYPEPSVFGTNDVERAHVVNWMHRIYNEGFLPAAEALRNSSEAMKKRALPGPDDIEQIPALAERGRQRLPVFFGLLDAHLADRRFLVGDQLSQADIDAWVVLYFARWVKITPPETLGFLANWRQRVGQLVGQA